MASTKKIKANFFKVLKKKRRLFKKQTKRLKLIGYIVVITLGLQLILFGFYLFLYQQTVLSFRVAPTYESLGELRAATPTRVVVEESGIDLEVTPAMISNGIWEISNSSASHLVTSARPGEQGNIVIYGHNRSHLFKKLHEVEESEIITVVNETGKEYHYQVVERQVVSPEQIEVVLPTEKEQLTLYTCTGFLDSKRLVLIAKPV